MKAFAAALLLVLFLATAQAHAFTIVDQSNTQHLNGINGLSSDIAQTFTAGIAGTLYAIDLNIANTTGIGLLDDLVIEIWEAEQSAPLGTYLGESTTQAGTVLSGWTEFIFDETISVAVGTMYSIVVNGWGYSSMIGLFVTEPGFEYGVDGVYDGGSYWSNDPVNGWIEPQYANTIDGRTGNLLDLAFRAKVDVPVPEPSTMLLLSVGVIGIFSNRKKIINRH